MNVSLLTLVLFSDILSLLIFITDATLQPGDDLKATQEFQSQGDVTMTREKISKVSAEALASASATKLNKLSDEQLKGVGESLARSRKPTHLTTVMNKLRKDRTMRLALAMLHSDRKVSRRIRANVMENLKKKFNDDLSAILIDDIRRLGPEALKDLDDDDIKKITKHKEKFEVLSEELSKNKHLSDSKRRAIVNGAKTIHGETETWDKDVVGKYGAFARPNDLGKVKVKAIKEAIDQLAKNKGIKKTNARKILSKLADKEGLGSPSAWNATTLKRLGELAKGLKISIIKEMESTALKDAMEELGKVELSKSQARAIMDKIVRSHSTNSWIGDDLKKAGRLAKGLSAKDLKELRENVVKEALRELSAMSLELTPEQKREIAKKIGELSSWSKDRLKEIANLCYGKSSKELQGIDAHNATELVAAMTPEKSAPGSKNRVLKEKIFSTGNVNLTKAGPVVSVMTLNDLKNTDLKRELGIDSPAKEKMNLPWSQEQARQLVEKFKEQQGKADTWTENEVLGLTGCRLARGFSRDDISKIKYLPLEELADESRELLPAQRQAVLKSFKKDNGIEFSQLTEPGMKAIGDLAGDLSNEEWENLPKDVALQAIRQIGENEKFAEKPRGLVRNFLESALKKMGRESAEDVTEDDILDLGNLICGLSAEKISRITMKVFNATRSDFGKKKCFSPEQLKALAKKAKEYIEVERMTSDDILDQGTINGGFTPDDLRKIQDTVIKDTLDALGELMLSVELAKVALEKIAKRSSRRRRDTDVSTKTGQELVAMGNLLLGLSPSDIATVKNDTFDEAASTIGKINGFSQKQLEAWAAKAKQTWNSDPASFDEDQLLRLGAIAIGFSDSDLGKMDLSSDDVIESLGSQKVKSAETAGYSSSQLNEALSRIKSLKGKSTIDKFSGAEISNLKNFALALTIKEIGYIPKETFANCVASLGKINGWSNDQMKKLKEKAEQAYGPVSGWSTAKLRESGSTIGGFTKSELQSLSGEHISMVTPEAISSMPPSLFAAFTSDQLQEFDYNQAAAATDEQMQALPEDMKKVLKVKTGSIKPDSSGTTKVYASKWFIVLITAIIISI